MRQHQKFQEYSVQSIFSYSFILVKLVYSEKATKFCKIFPLLLSTVHTDKSKGKIAQNFVAFSEYINFTYNNLFMGSFLEIIFSNSQINFLRFSNQFSPNFVYFIFLLDQIAKSVSRAIYV